MRFRCFLLITGLALLLVPTIGTSQFGEQPGGFGGQPGGGRGGFSTMDPDAIWNQITGGKAVWKRSEITDPDLLRRFDRAAQMVGATNGEITKEQYVRKMREVSERFTQGDRGPGGPAKGVAGPGPQWEYKVQTREGIAELGKTDFAAGLNKLGDEGWELVAVPGVEAGRGFPAPRAPEYYFKRRKGPAARQEPVAAEHDYRTTVLPLKHAVAPDLAKTLQEIFPNKGGELALVADPRTNTLIIRGPQKQVEQVEELAQRLDMPGAEDRRERKKP